MRTVLRRRDLALILLAILLFLVVYNFDAYNFNISKNLHISTKLIKKSNSINQTIASLNWPVFVGSDNGRVTSETSHPDPLLLDKLLTAMAVMKTPLFRLKTDTDQNSKKIEKIFHQSWKNTQIPNLTSQWISKWKEIHPDWTYIFWTDESARQFIKDYFPSLLAHYDSWTVPVQRADMFRYIAVYAFGGIWADIDMEPLKSLEPLRDWASCILSREPDAQVYLMNSMCNYANNYTFACNAFFACSAHHPFMFYMISRTIQKSPLFREKPCKLSETIVCTGPWIMSLVYAYYRRSISEAYRAKHPEYDVICPEFEYFLPTFDETRRKLLEKNCKKRNLNEKQKKICEKLKSDDMKNKPANFSYTDHHWIHTYHNDVSKKTVYIDELTEWTNYTSDEFTVTYT